MDHRREEAIGAPPDAGGHLGSETRPQDVRALPDDPEHVHGPPTNQDQNLPKQRSGGSNWLVLMILTVILILSAWLGRYAI